MATKRKASTKKALESKIAELEAKLNQLSAKLETKPEVPKPAETKPAEAPKPEAPKPAETKPAEATKPEAPKPAETKPAEAPKPEAPKPAETTTQPPITFQAALEDAYYNAEMTSFHDYRTKVTGYAPAANRYFTRLHAPVGTVPTLNWNDQKAKVTGYTQPSNQYFATRQRLAYSPPGKTFGSFSGVSMSVEGIEIKTQAPEPPKPAEVTQQAPPPQQSSSSSNTGSSKKQSLEEYEAEYMKRLANEQREQEELMRAAAELKAKRQAESQPSGSQSTKGSLPKGF